MSTPFAMESNLIARKTLASIYINKKKHMFSKNMYYNYNWKSLVAVICRFKPANWLLMELMMYHLVGEVRITYDTIHKLM